VFVDGSKEVCFAQVTSSFLALDHHQIELGLMLQVTIYRLTNERNAQLNEVDRPMHIIEIGLKCRWWWCELVSFENNQHKENN